MCVCVGGGGGGGGIADTPLMHVIYSHVEVPICYFVFIIEAIVTHPLLV